MRELWVLTASPLITLAHIGALGLLTALSEDVLVPEPVVAEINAGPPGDPARLALAAGWGTCIAAIPVPASIVEWSLTAGENAALAIAHTRPGHVAVVDDAVARACARVNGIPMISTIGVVLRAKQKGVVFNAVSLIHRLRATGLHLDDATIAAAVQRATRESWTR